MFIKHLSISNFKSIETADMTFEPLTMLVGANASGKSNIINVFRFISNIATDGIDNAIALQGGIPYLANASLSNGTPIEISFDVDLSNEGWIRSSGIKTIGLEIRQVKYQFVIQPNLKGAGYHISRDKLELSFGCLQINYGAKEDDRYMPMGSSLSFVFEKKSSKSSISWCCNIENKDNLDEKTIENLSNDLQSRLFSRICNENKKELMLYRIEILLPSIFSKMTFIRMFDFDPKELKKSSSMASMRILEENGSNIASVLQNILRTKDNRRKLTTLLTSFLPFVNGITMENNFDKSFSYKMKEKYSNSMFHANFLSDGTVSILALVIALHFEQSANIIILEEPERNIHPKLLSKVLSSAEDVSSEKQIIITTHNPEFLKHAKIENVRLVTRSERGFTLITTPGNSDAVNCFLHNDLGLDDLFLQDMLGE